MNDFYQIPDGWTHEFLDAIAIKITDGAHFSPIPQEHGELIANVKDMGNDHIDFGSCTKITKKAFEELKKQNCSPDKGDILLSKDGTIGKVILYDDDREIVVLSSIAIIRLKESANPDYVKHSLRSFIFDKQLYALQSGSALKRIVLADIRKLWIPLPSPPTQDKIAKILTTIDGLIEKTQELIDKHSAIKQGMTADLFTRGIDLATGQLRPPVEQAPHLYIQTELGWKPKEWNVDKLGNFTDICRGASPRPIGDPKYFGDSCVGWVRISDVTKSKLYLTKTTQYLSHEGESKSVRVYPGDLVMSICATVGKPIILAMDACIHDGFVLFSNFESTFNKKFLLYWLAENEGTFNNMGQPGTQVNLNTTLVGSLKSIIPTLDEQARIVKTIDRISDRISTEEKLLRKLLLKKHGLMQDLLTGKVTVS